MHSPNHHSSRIITTSSVLSFFLFLSCSNPVSVNDEVSVLTCMNGFAVNTWQTLDLHFKLADSLNWLSISPGQYDTLCLDTIWIGENYDSMAIYTFDHVDTSGFDTSYQLMIRWSVLPVDAPMLVMRKLDANTLAFCPEYSSSDSAGMFEADIGPWRYPNTAVPKTNGHVRIRLKINKH